MIIENLVQHLRNQFPAESFYCNTRENTALQPSLPDNCVLVQQGGGPSQPWTRYTQGTYQVLVRNKVTPYAKKLAQEIFDELHGRFGLILPAATVGAVTYLQKVTAEIRAVQLPYCLGADGAGRTSFTTNYIIIYEEK